MNRTVRRSFEWSLVIALTVLLGGSPASAGWLRNKLKSHCCKPAASSCVMEQPSCHSPAPTCAPTCAPAPTCCPEPSTCAAPAPMATPSIPCCDYSAVPSCCGGSADASAPMGFAPVEMGHSYDMGMPIEMGMPMESGMPIEGTIVDDAMMAAPIDGSMNQGTIVEQSQPAPPETVEQPSDSMSEMTPPVPAEAEATMTEPEPTVTDSTMTEPAEAESMTQPESDPTADNNDDDLFGGSSMEEPTEMEEPAEMTPPEQPPEQPIEEPAENMSADDLFGGSVDSAPAAPADDDDLFGGSSMEQPAAPESSNDDLFGDPPADTPADGANEIDDLFGDPPASGDDAAPATEEQPSIDDLFGNSSQQDDSTTGSMVAEKTVAEKPIAEETVSDETSLDDLFGTSESTEEVAETPSQKPAEKDNAEFDIDDLFGSTSTPTAQPVAAATESAEATVHVVSKKMIPIDALGETRSRTWIDNTGNYHVEGRLIEIASNHVRLLKANGRTCTVPSKRLCEADTAYVNSIRQQSDSSRLAMLTSK